MSRYTCSVDANQPEIVRALERCGCEVEDLSRVGQGFPDLLVYRPSIRKLVLMEVKTHRGRMRVRQNQFASRFPVVVVRTVEEALRAMDIIE